VVGGDLMTLIASTLQAFFTDRLATQRQASPRVSVATPSMSKMTAANAGPAAGRGGVRRGVGHCLADAVV
jgi:hypothetical protein